MSARQGERQLFVDVEMNVHLLECFWTKFDCISVCVHRDRQTETYKSVKKRTTSPHAIYWFLRGILWISRYDFSRFSKLRYSDFRFYFFKFNDLMLDLKLWIKTFIFDIMNINRAHRIERARQNGAHQEN